MPEVVMPRLSDTMEEGVLSRWLKKEGDAVRQGDVIGEIDTDKATMELESFDDGVLEKLLVPEGTTVAIGQPLAVIGSGGRTAGTSTETSPDTASGTMPTRTVGIGPSPRLLSSPLARRDAARHGLDPATITGTGPGGRIVRADVEAAVVAMERSAVPGTTPRLDTNQPAPSSAPQPVPSSAPQGVPSSSPKPTPPPSTSDIHQLDAGTQADSVEVPLTQMRKVTARRLTESAAAPHFYLTIVVGMDRLLDFRREVNERFTDRGIRVSVTDLLVRACAVTLRAHPQVNSSWATDRILTHRRINVGVAVALADGLIVPVVTEADAKSLDQIAGETRNLAEKARAGTLSLQEFSGGTFTISNLGMFGIDNFTAVINPPEAAILAVGATTEEPYVQDGELRTRRVMKITLTSDHRVLDGATAAAFLSDLKRNLEDPLRIVI
ncbi:2-oxo acid dehydrogenase subunit E2 [Paenarthrobacter sp. Z7-10]|uniref:dihydrolipoamide acetyltransferase family protein n=1 Tax=Paenarthrobacter sp. Z7-10 TaxID=2787635 RepID=UPI0022A8F366|nr:dihydrolipoamide acetyltransferase family protein [Paenarthrobacter sp. Z7-10]MCZ2402016.1 2-oxo acid dehydrogenase subunit E2 [Paenarthrobacter sp. Z7-10]